MWYWEAIFITHVMAGAYELTPSTSNQNKVFAFFEYPITISAHSGYKWIHKRDYYIGPDHKNYPR